MHELLRQKNKKKDTINISKPYHTLENYFKNGLVKLQFDMSFCYLFNPNNKL